jgi:hypothetical protein
MRTHALVPTALTALAFAVLLAGCSNGPDGQSASAPGSLAYNGASAGTQSSGPFQCDGGGDVSFSANLGSGTVTVSVKDAAGKVVYTKTTGSAGQTSESKSVSGAPGSWSLTATRGAGFAGQYAANVDC